MKTVTQTLMGTTVEWGRTNPVLLEGMLGVEVRADGTRRVKIGDGEKNWLNPALKALGVGDIEGLSEEVSGMSAALQNNIDAERAARESAIAAEAQERRQADAALQNNIDAERAARESAIAAEAQERRQADAALQNNIDAERAARESAVAAEAQTRQRDDDKVMQAIADIISFVETELGRLDFAFPLTVEGGDYLITENDDYLVVA